MEQKLESSTNYDIFKFLEDHIVENGQKHTHTSMGLPKGSYYIKSNELDTFYKLYDEALFNGKKLHITERHEDISPMIIDLDFKYEIETYERKHTKEHIKKIIQLYIDEICLLFNIEKGNVKLTSFVFERDTIYSAKTNTVKKDGIHIMFPFIISYTYAQYYIRDNILKKIGDIINELHFKNNISDVVDRSILASGTCWLLYGSNKPLPEVKNNPYNIKYVFNENVEEVSLEEYFQDINISLPRFFSIRDKKESDLTPIREEKLIYLENNKKKIAKKVRNNVDYDINKIKDLVSILNISRADNYSQWLEVGWLLHNIDPNSDELLDIWIDFSKKSDKFKEGECLKIWEKSRNEGLTYGTLHYWAKIDNYQKYIELRDKDLDTYIETSIKTQSDYDIAYVLYKMFEYDFKYSDDDWYVYKNHRWHKEQNGMSLRKYISTDLFRKFGYKITFYNKLASNPEISDEEKEEYKAKNKIILEITKKIKSTSSKENIMKECRELFHDKEFYKKIDTNPFLIGFSNGIYDLKKKELRCGRPDDYVELSTDIEKIDFDENHEYWPELNNFISTIFCDDEVKNYFLTYLASCIQGHNAEEKFRIWTGVGCHGYDTDIMMFNGEIKKVQDINIDDKLMGDDYTERNVIELKHGYSDMYEISNPNFETFIVNGNHILCLSSENNNIIEISVDNLINLPEYHPYKTHYYLYNKDKIKYSYTIKKIKKDFYYGFELDNNHRYIMGNGIITHNSNGKSKILELIVHSLGNYTIKFPITMLTGKRAASNACTPEILQAKGKRFGYFEEPSEQEKINAGLLKEFTGGDKIKARGLHKDPIEFKPQFKLALLCNEMPEVPPTDTGTWRRMEVIEFKSRFCEHPKEINEFPIDMNLSEKLKNWKELFMALLIDVYYDKYTISGINVPIEVIKFTLEYQKQCDMYTDFIYEHLEETKDNNDIIEISYMYEEFKTWFQDSYNTNKIPSKVEFKKYLKKKFMNKKVSNTEIRGFKFKEVNNNTSIIQQKMLFQQQKSKNQIENLSGY
jgi:P4 family phage/plasmid primase-like protien